MNWRVQFLKFLDLVLITIPFALSWSLYYGRRVYLAPFWNRGNYVVVLLFLVLFALAGRVYEAFAVGLSGVPDLVFSQGLAAGVANAAMYLILCLLLRTFPNAVPLLLAFAAEFVLALLWAVGADRACRRLLPPKATVVLYDRREGMEELISRNGYGRIFSVRRSAPAAEAVEDPSLFAGAEAVFLCGIRSSQRNEIMKQCIGQGKEVYTVPRVGDMLMQGADRMHLFPFPLYRVRERRLSVAYRALKRAADILLSGAALLVTSPVVAVTALLIRREDGGPVLYRQERLTEGGRVFTIYKLRSMRVDAEDKTGAVLSSGPGDERLTRTGRVIRRFRIDEIPQFVNILRGDMSLVGPRPERPEIVRETVRELPEFTLRLRVKAGLTGLAQVYGRYSTDLYDKLLLDLEYINKAGPVEDLKIILATVKILFLKESAE